MSRILQLSAPSRLHFGLLSFGRPDARQYGGVGLMIQSPGITLQVSSAPAFQSCGPLATRVDLFARRWAEFHSRDTLPACRFEVVAAAPQHSGLGVGTQLGLSVAAALHTWLGEPCPSPSVLARSVQRGLRSAVGAYGFAEGGLIVERGKLPDEEVSPLDCRIDMPPGWRVVLAIEPAKEGLSGADEHAAFHRLPAVSPETTQRLADELRNHLLPAAARGLFEEFSESVYRYGHEAGQCFAAVQGGPYNGPTVAARVHRLRELGVRGAGQSSWGPTVYALQADETAAQQLVTRLQNCPEFAAAELLIAPICNRGAEVRWLAPA